MLIKMWKEKIQQANTQWQTWANGLQDIVRNLKRQNNVFSKWKMQITDNFRLKIL